MAEASPSTPEDGAAAGSTGGGRAQDADGVAPAPLRAARHAQVPGSAGTPGSAVPPAEPGTPPRPARRTSPNKNDAASGPLNVPPLPRQGEGGGPGSRPRSEAVNGPAEGRPSPDTGVADPAHAPAAPVRGRSAAPAGGEPSADRAGGTSSPPAGSTAALFLDLRDAEKTAQERTRRADAKAFLDAHRAGKMTEAQLEEQIRDACETLGILRFHVRFSMGTTAGLPDDILVGSGGILWRECKTAKGKVTAAQQQAGEKLTAAGQDWAVWRPADWFSGRITRELAALSGITGRSIGNHPAGRRLPPEGTGGGTDAA